MTILELVCLTRRALLQHWQGHSSARGARRRFPPPSTPGSAAPRSSSVPAPSWNSGAGVCDFHYSLDSEFICGVKYVAAFYVPSLWPHFAPPRQAPGDRQARGRDPRQGHCVPGSTGARPRCGFFVLCALGCMRPRVGPAAERAIDSLTHDAIASPTVHPRAQLASLSPAPS